MMPKSDDRESFRSEREHCWTPSSEMTTDRDGLPVELQETLHQIEQWHGLADYRAQMSAEDRDRLDRRREPRPGRDRRGT